MRWSSIESSKRQGEMPGHELAKRYKSTLIGNVDWLDPVTMRDLHVQNLRI